MAKKGVAPKKKGIQGVQKCSANRVIGKEACLKAKDKDPRCKGCNPKKLLRS